MRIFKIFLIAVLLCGCNANPTAIKTQGKLKVYTSFHAMWDFAQKIGGDKIDPVNLIPGGTEAHSWEPSAGMLVELENADVLLYNGLGMENWIEKIKSGINNPGLVYGELSAYTENTAAEDPHVWLNPQNAKKQLEAIKNILSEKDPGNAEYFNQNYETNAKKIDELDKKYKDTVEKFCKKTIVVSHAAYGYLCEAYGLNQVSLQGMYSEHEPTPAHMAQIVDYIRLNNVKCIFYEELSGTKSLATIGLETGVELLPLNPFEGLTDQQVQNGEDYFSVMEQNLINLEKALS